MKLAQIQMHVTADKAANLRHAEDLLRSVRGADMAILPEMFCCPYDNACFRAYGEPEGGPAYQMLSRAARELNLWLVGGSLPELDGDKIYNTAYVFDPTGTCVARHRKMHLFDIDVQGGQSFREMEGKCLENGAANLVVTPQDAEADEIISAELEKYVAGNQSMSDAIANMDKNLKAKIGKAEISQ